MEGRLSHGAMKVYNWLQAQSAADAPMRPRQLALASEPKKSDKHSHMGKSKAKF